VPLQPVEASVILLDPRKIISLFVPGNGVLATNSSIQVNATDDHAVSVAGNGYVAAAEVHVAGGCSRKGNHAQIVTYLPDAIHMKSNQVQDPLRNLPHPDKSKMPRRSSCKLKYSAGSHHLQPGVYKGGISCTGKASLTMEPGIYYMDGGGFNFDGQGDLAAEGVMIFNDPHCHSDRIKVNGMGHTKLSPPASGKYRGICLFQRRDADVPVQISGNGYITASGTFYAAGSEVNVHGNGSEDIGSQYICRRLSITGNAHVEVQWKPETAPYVCPSQVRYYPR
jgi:hypothetical protein